MRCRVCGFVADPDAAECPNCGAKLPVTEKKTAAADSEMSWNTRDFPKPKEMTDIKMSWPDIRSHTVSISEDEIKEALDRKEPVTVMSEDATEGYISKPAAEAEAEPRKIAVRTAPELKPDESEPAPQFWYTQKFTATGVMQTGPAWPAAPGNSKPSYPTTATIETMTLSDPVPISSEVAAAAAEAAAKKQAGETSPSGFTLEDLLEECTEEDIPKPHPEDHFYTFKKKNEEFQKLLDLEYDRFHAMHGEDRELIRGNTGRPFAPEETVQAKELSAFERMLLEGVPQRQEETPAQKFFSQDAEPEVSNPFKASAEAAPEPEAPEEPAGLADILQPKNTADTKDPDPGLFVIPSGDPSKFNIEEIEHTIRELQAQEIEAENNRSERKKRLAAMAAAREAYFASLDAMEEKKRWFSREPKREAKPAAAVVEAKPAAEEESVLDASPIEGIFDDPDAEPTKEIPVGSILKALAAGGVAAASVAAAKTAGEETVRVRTADMSAAAPSITEDVFRTRVFTRPLSEEAEALARRYEQPAEKKAAEPEDLAKKYEEPVAEPVEEPAAEAPVEEPAVEAPVEEAVVEAPAEDPAIETPLEESAEEPAFEAPAETVEAPAFAIPAEELKAELPEDPADLPSLRELVEQARAAEAAKTGEPTEQPAAPFEQPADPVEEPAPAAEPAEEPAPVTEAFIQEAAQEVPEHSTQPFDVDSIEKAAAAALSRPLGTEESDDEDDEDDDDAPGSKHIILKIIAIILIICALFEGAVLGLKKFAPEAPITGSAVQIEEAIGEAIMSFFDSIGNLFNRGN